jgi:sugar phosphate isomerase/epimerase
MQLTACLWGLPGDPLANGLAMLELGYDTVDVDPGFAALDPRPLPPITCLAAGHLFPEGVTLYSEDETARSRAVARVAAALREAAALECPVAYIAAPGPGPEARAHFRESAVQLAAAAAESQIRLCIEPFPSSGIDSVAAMLDFISETGRDDLYVLLDVGHCQIVDEDPAGAVAQCGERLGYVHFDDNDGAGDLHLALTDGLLTRDVIRESLVAVELSPYDGPVAFEGHLNLADPMAAMAKSLRILKECDPG